MKVLLIQKIAGVAGSENYCLNLLPRLVSAGVEAHFLCVQAPANAIKVRGFVESLVKGGVKVHIIDSELPVSWSLIHSIYRLIRTERYDLVQTNLLHADVWGGIIKQLFMPEMALVSVKHGYSERYQAEFGFDPSHVRLNAFSVLTRWAGRKANRIVTISDGLRNFLTRSGLVESSKCHVIPYGFSFSSTTTCGQAEVFRYGEPQLLIVGRLVQVKQHHLVLKILPELVRQFPKLKLIIVGSGPLESMLKNIAATNGVGNNVVWLGFRTNVHDYLKASDVLILPSSAEGFGLVILEAWYNKIPVMAFDVPAPNEIISDGETGVLVPPFDTAAMVEKLSFLLSEPDVARAMGERGNATYNAQYTVDVMLNSTIALYREVLNERFG